MKNIKISNHTKDPLISFSLLLVILFQLNGFTWISELLLSFGIPQLRFQKLFFLYIPMSYIVVRNIRNNQIRLNKTIYIILFFLTHYLMENFLYGPRYFPDNPLELVDIWTNILLGYLALINTSIKFQQQIINYFILCTILIYLIVFLDLFTNLDIASVSVGQGDFAGRLYSGLNLNLICDLGSLSIILIYYLKFNFNQKNFYGFNYLLLIFFFISLILLQSSRGSLLLLIPVLFAYSYKQKNNIKFVVPLFTILFYLVISGFSFSNISLFQRIQNSSLNETEALLNYDGRYLQVLSSYKNFKSSPLIGVGYKNAADGHYYGITRSNFHYTQILASGGLFLFIIYFFVMYKFFASSVSLIFKDEYLWLFLCFVLLYFVFRRPNAFFSIIAYLVYCRELYARK